MNARWIIAVVLAAALLFLGIGQALPAEPKSPGPTFTVASLAVEGDMLVVRFKATYPSGMVGTWDPEAVKISVARLVTVLNGAWEWTVFTPLLKSPEPPPPPPPPDVLIQAFTIQPLTIKKGESAKLAWTCPKAKSVTLNGLTVAVSGSQNVTPDTTTAYNLAATDGLKIETAQRTLTVTDLPPPDSKWQVMIVTETDQLDDLPKGQQALCSGLTFRQALEAKGHKFLRCIDQDSAAKAPDQWKPWLEAAKDKPRPTLLLAPVQGGDIKGYPLPADEAAFWTLLDKGVK